MYAHGGDHLEAEFERALFVLESAIQPPDGTTGDRTATVSGSNGSETSATALRSTGSKLRSLSGADSTTHESAFDLGSAERTKLEELTADIDDAVEQTREVGTDLRLVTLASAFDLSRPQLDALLFALAPAFDRTIGYTYGAWHGSNRPKLLTIDLLEDLLVCIDRSSDESEARSLGEVLAPSSPLFQYDLLVRHRTGGGTPATYDTVTVDKRIVDYLKGEDSLDRALADLVSIERAERTLSDLIFDEVTTDTLETVRDRSTATEAPTIYHFAGEDGTGKDRLPAALTDAGTPILRADATDIVEDDDLCTRLIREAALQDAAIHLTGLERVTDRHEEPAVGLNDEGGLAMPDPDAPTVDSIVERFDDAPGDVFVSHTEDWKPDVDLAHHRVETVHCPFPEYNTRLTIWEEYADEVAESYLVENVATNFRLPQHDIRRAIKTARYLCRSEQEGVEAPEESASADAFAPVDGELEREHLYEACKRYSASNLEALADRMEPGYELDDLYLNDKPKTHLRELCGHLQYRGAVTSEWGFGEPGSRGDGVVALFYGQPGTGKTMAAEILANETGLDLYRVDLAQIVDKYIGETESQLAALLDEAERSNAILLFDEADSLFGERTDVGDATDRHANNVTNFLLQRLESFDGIALLTTNKRSGIDPAFKRRIAHAIRFDVPQEHLRRQLWRESFPDEANVDTSEFDYGFLGMKSLTPAIIRKVAKYAAYIAATEAHEGQPLSGETNSLADVTITFDHVILALQYASEAGGVALGEEFYGYEDRLRTYDTQHVNRDFETRFRMRYLDGEGLGGDGLGDESTSDETATSDPGAGDGTDDRGVATGRDSGSTGPHDGTDSDGTAAEEGDDTGIPEPDSNARDPETVVRQFYDRIHSRDVEGLAALYHADADVDPLSKRDVIAMDLTNVELAGSIDRIVDEADRTVLEFVETSNSHELPTEIECRPDDGRWRIYAIRRDAPTETA
ncbi:AAA+ family ATPase [Halovivax ruber XH-70]|uniref:AAA+ family ATPase n=1 Tax=Halovivax ruber (strain DSM 18193 / JCM 13892 / XH-70) TaxID=797302 RepID=L0I9Z6_HALRX|nr:ATP-binding protein [Halovivax ruber]AGB15066.1 AAA+ family ATPase [Halovivax ruber XH-70]